MLLALLLLLPVRHGIHGTVKNLPYFILFDKRVLLNWNEISTGDRVKASL